MKICHTVVKILTFNKRLRSLPFPEACLSYLRSMEITDVSIDAVVVLAKQKQTKWCLVPKILVVVY